MDKMIDSLHSRTRKTCMDEEEPLSMSSLDMLLLSSLESSTCSLTSDSCSTVLEIEVDVDFVVVASTLDLEAGTSSTL